MTVNSNDRRKRHTGNGVATAFDGPRARSASYISVYVDDVLQSSGYTVTRTDGRAPTLITFNAAPASGADIVITRTLPLIQGTDITNQGAFLPEIHEDAFDERVMQLQQVDDMAQRSLRLPETSDGWDTTLPTPERGMVMGWDPNLNKPTYYTPEQIATVAAFTGFRTETFDAEVGQTEFELDGWPGVISNTVVAVNGVVQAPEQDYLLDDGKLILLNAMLGGERVLVHYGEAVPNGVADAQAVSYGGGSVAGRFDYLGDVWGELAENNGALMVGTATGDTVEERFEAIEVGMASGLKGYDTYASLASDLAHPAGTLMMVTNDSDPDKNGTYRKTGSSGSGSWVLSEDRTTQLASRVSAIDEGVEHKELPEDSGSVYAVADAAGRPSFVDVDISGDPTPQATGRILNSLRRSSGFANIAALGDGLVQNEVSTPDTGIGFAITGEDGSQTDLEVDGNGKFTARVLKGIADRVKDEIGAPVDIDNPAPYILIVGDSLSAGATASNDANRWRNRLSVLTGIEHRNMAVGGETARTIISRVGCMSFLATVDGGEIPASGAVEVALTGYDGGVVNPFIQGNETSWAINPCSIAGVTGALSESGGSYVFTRSEAGDAVVVGEIPQRVVTYAYNNHRRGITIWWLGQNGGYVDNANLLAMVKAGTAWQTDSRFLVMTPPTSTADARAPIEALFRDAFGDKYVNIRAYMSSYWALDLAGITPTATDESDIAVGRVPESLRGDSVHHNDAGQLVIATVLYNRGKELGYWS